MARVQAMDAQIKTTPRRSPRARVDVDGRVIHSIANPRKEQIMKKSLNVVLATLLAGSASLAVAHPGASTLIMNTLRFNQDQFRTLQQESTPMPSGSPPVDRNAKAEDPIPKVTTLAQREAWFKVENQRLQRESTSMPAGSPPVNKYDIAADPIPKATTSAQKAAAFAEEERFLQQKSTR